MRDTERASGDLLPIVTATGAHIARVERVRPTLEDVFLELVGRESTSDMEAA